MSKKRRIFHVLVLCSTLSTIWLLFYNVHSLFIRDMFDFRPPCKHIIPSSSYNISTGEVSWNFIESNIKNVKAGGHFRPADCRSTWKVAVIVPYKGEEKYLKVFLRHIHPFMQQQNIEYGIFLIEMTSATSFNRGLLMNAGFKETSKLYHSNCFIFHEVDMLPENIRNIYECSDHPKHMSTAIDKRHIKLSHMKNLGGVKAFTTDQFKRINGFSNVYFNSGKEDIHLYYRARNANITIQKLPSDIGRYKDLGRHDASIAQENLKLYQLREQVRASEGLSSMVYQMTKLDIKPLYTRIEIGIKECVCQRMDGNGHTDVSDDHNQVDGFYSYVSNKGIAIETLQAGRKYNISYAKWSCVIDTANAKGFIKRNISWKDMFETRIDVLSKKTNISQEILRKKIGKLPEDGKPITLVARQGNESIPKDSVIIRLNNHGPLDAKTTMIMTWPNHVKTIIMSSRKQPNHEIVNWTHIKPPGNGRYYGLWNMSQPIAVPESVWNFQLLKYYRGPVFFMKGKYDFGNLIDCKPNDGIGLAALTRVLQLKGEVSTLGFSLGLDKYNTEFKNRFRLLVNKLVYSYFIVEELTNIL